MGCFSTALALASLALERWGAGAELICRRGWSESAAAVWIWAVESCGKMRKGFNSSTSKLKPSRSLKSLAFIYL
jgi:hypothetical protein